MKQLKINKYKVAVVMSIILLVLTPMVNKIVNILFRSGIERQVGFGSECLLWLFPIMIIGLMDAISNKME